MPARHAHVTRGLRPTNPQAVLSISGRSPAGKPETPTDKGATRGHVGRTVTPSTERPATMAMKDSDTRGPKMAAQRKHTHLP